MMPQGPERPTPAAAVEGEAGVSGDIARGAAERLAFFSDAVVAIAITLLAIELPVPEGNSDTEFLHSLGAQSFTYITFLISFIAIANHWAAHHRIFRWVARADRPLVLLNLTWLLLIVLTPWLTEIVREGDDLTWTRFGMYAVAQALLLFLLAVMVGRMSAKGLLLDVAPGSLRRRGWVGPVLSGLGFLVSIPLFPLLGAWAFAVWVVVPLILNRLSTVLGWVPRRSHDDEV